MNNILDYLDNLFPNPKCELLYNNDYQLLLAIVLSAQTTDVRVNSVTSVLFKRFDSLEKLANASLNELENILKPIGSFRKKSIYIKEISNILFKQYNCIVPVDRDILLTFPGVGRKTINVFLSEYYDIPAIAVDTHVERVSKRLGLVGKNDDVYTIEKKLMRKILMNEWGRRHLQMVLFGRYYCKSKKPLCRECYLKNICLEKNKNL